MELRSYMKKLTAIHKAIYLQEKRKEPREETETSSPVVPGDQVYLSVFRRKWNEPRREGPYKVVRATPTAVQVEGSTTWYHLNHCTRVPRRRTERERNRQADNSGERDEEKQDTQDEVQTKENSKKDSQGTHILLSVEEERRGERTCLTTYRKIIICLVHLIIQVQTQPTESNLTSLQLTVQPLNNSDNDTTQSNQQ